MSKVAFMFPGQGAQYVGMGKDFYETPESKVNGLPTPEVSIVAR